MPGILDLLFQFRHTKNISQETEMCFYGSFNVTVATETFFRTWNSQTMCLNCSDGIFAEQNCDPRKHINELKLESLRSRLNVLLYHINVIANREVVCGNNIATDALKLISIVDHYRKVSCVCSEIFETCTFAQPQKQLSIDKSAFLLDSLEIGKRK